METSSILGGHVLLPGRGRQNSQFPSGRRFPDDWHWMCPPTLALSSSQCGGSRWFLWPGTRWRFQCAFRGYAAWKLHMLKTPGAGRCPQWVSQEQKGLNSKPCAPWLMHLAHISPPPPNIPSQQVEGKAKMNSLCKTSLWGRGQGEKITIKSEKVIFESSKVTSAAM